MRTSSSRYIRATDLLNATTHFKPFHEIAAPLSRARIPLAETSFNTPINFSTPQENEKKVF